MHCVDVTIAIHSDLGKGGERIAISKVSEIIRRLREEKNQKQNKQINKQISRIITHVKIKKKIFFPLMK